MAVHPAQSNEGRDPSGLFLRPGREASLVRRHPWVFSGAVSSRIQGLDSRHAVKAFSSRGELLGSGFLSPSSPIVMRVWRFGDGELDAEYVRGLVAGAIALRSCFISDDTDGYRVIHAEGDHLPGLIVDRYGSVLAVQATTEGTERARELWLPSLLEFFPGATIVQKNGLPSRGGEGLPAQDELLAGGELPKRAAFREHGLVFVADIESGQKTGFFLDQRENRSLVRRLGSGRRVLNLFAYSGAFGVCALSGGASRVVHVDSSKEALALARENHVANGQPVDEADSLAGFVAADVSRDLRARSDAQEQWDLIVTDPPAFAKRKEDVERAARGYKDINRLAMKLLAPGGFLLACSCSGPLSSDLFQKILFAAALDAGVRMQIVEERGAGPDHPVSIDCPEGNYLKAFLLRRS